MIHWQSIDTVLFDMDGTLLDLRYDNHVWNELLPRHYSAVHGVATSDASDRLTSHMRDIAGSIQFYCLDYWARHTQLDLMAPHREATHLIRWRPNAQPFVRAVRASGRRAFLVTNAHRNSIDIKHLHSGVGHELDIVVSSHDYGEPKESQGFWRALMAAHPFDPARTLFIDDNHQVLDAARRFGIGQVLSIQQPDSSRPHRNVVDFAAIDDFGGHMPDTTAE
ncbi:MAG: GMP/IMP nucleotidase [Pseudomonadales bacterium]|nr:GMP/IMP nucleotidase [Pseudomonadales bacterium]MCP5184138.1 GMP/IMP nucleotidase [Pseudomonadales bacterium]